MCKKTHESKACSSALRGVEGRGPAVCGKTHAAKLDEPKTEFQVKGLILAQNERWRRG